MEQVSFIKINKADTVVVCLRNYQKGETINVDGKAVTVMQDTPAGHKILIHDTPEGENIINFSIYKGYAYLAQETYTTEGKAHAILRFPVNDPDKEEVLFDLVPPDLESQFSSREITQGEFVSLF